MFAPKTKPPLLLAGGLLALAAKLKPALLPVFAAPPNTLLALVAPNSDDAGCCGVLAAAPNTDPAALLLFVVDVTAPKTEGAAVAVLLPNSELAGGVAVEPNIALPPNPAEKESTNHHCHEIVQKENSRSVKTAKPEMI